MAERKKKPVNLKAQSKRLAKKVSAAKAKASKAKAGARKKRACK